MSKNKFYYGDIVKLKDKDIWGIVTNREDLKPNLVIETILPDHYAIDNIVIHQSKLETAATPLAPLTKAKLKSMVQGRPLSSLDYVRFYSLKGTADYTLNAADIFKGVDKLLNGNGTPFTADTFNIWSLIIEKLITEAYPEEIPDIAADGTFKDAVYGYPRISVYMQHGRRCTLYRKSRLYITQAFRFIVLYAGSFWMLKNSIITCSDTIT